MKEILSETEKSSRNAVEELLNLLESIRLEDKSYSFSEDIDLIEKIVMAQERTLQDIGSNKIPPKMLDDINILYSDFITFFIKKVDIAREQPRTLTERYLADRDIIKSKIINNLKIIQADLIMGLSILTSFSIKNNSRYQSYFIKLNNLFKTPQDSLFDTSTMSEIELNMFRLNVMRVIVADPNNSNMNQYLLRLAKTFDKSLLKKTADFNRDTFNEHHLVNDFIKETDINIIEFISLSVEEIIIKTKLLNTDGFFERLFQIDELKNEIITWNISVNISGLENYSALQLGTLISSISAALESIDDVEVNLKHWRDGSKIFDIELKIKSNSGKVSILDLLKKVRQSIESIMLKKPLDQIKKLEAETNKTNIESEKIKKDIEAMPDAEMAQNINALNLIEKTIDLQSKELDIQEKRLAIQDRKLDLALKASKLFKEGLIQQDGDIQVFINECLFLRKNSLDNNITSGNSTLDEIEGHEIKTREKEGENPNV